MLFDVDWMALNLALITGQKATGCEHIEVEYLVLVHPDIGLPVHKLAFFRLL